MRFLAYDLAIDLIVALRPTIATLKRHDAALTKQFRDALGSISLNLGEGNGRSAATGSSTSVSRSAASAKSVPCSMSRWRSVTSPRLRSAANAIACAA